MPEKPAVVWFRNDLRLEDNPALAHAAASGAPIIPLYLWSPDGEQPWAPGAASRVWLHASLAALDARLNAQGSQLLLRTGDPLTVLRETAKSSGAQAVYWNRRYEPQSIARDAHIKAALREDGLEVQSFNAALLLEPAKFFNKQGEPYRVFTPFYKAASREIAVDAPIPAPKKLPAPKQWPKGVPLAALELLPRVDWAGGIHKASTPGEAQARSTLGTFLREGLAHYPDGRDFPAEAHVSRLSPHLHFGEISPRQIVQALHAFAAGADVEVAAESYLRQLYWREFAHYLLWHFPDTPAVPLNKKFARFPWRKDEALLRAWQRGQTGYPLVDAGMRELWETGWMHNRVRMVAASFLVKHLLQPWQSGAGWFWDTLVDADLANNTLGWQWVAGCGADAAPYFRIFNPVKQGEKFDAGGEYVRRWVPELSQLPDKWVHQPWAAPAAVLGAAGVALSGNYPAPVVVHEDARARALEAYNEIK